MKTKNYLQVLLLLVMCASGANYNIKNTSSATHIIGTAPLNLMEFDAFKNGNKVEVFWCAKSETNYSFFTLERSGNGIDFEKVSKINAATNITNAIHYIETDFKPLPGISYYRLKITSSNKKNIYSHTVLVNCYHDKNNINTFPGPNNGDLNNNIKKLESTEILVVLRDLSGNEYYSKIVASVHNSEIIGIDTEKKLTPGIYIVTASSNNILYSQKIIIQ